MHFHEKGGAVSQTLPSTTILGSHRHTRPCRGSQVMWLLPRLIALTAYVMFGPRSFVVAAGPEAEFARLMNVGKAELENRDSAKAIDALTKATAMRPDSAPAWRNLARAQFLAGDFDGAAKTLETAAKLEPASVATEYLTGLVYLRTSKFEEAVPHLEQAVRLDPDTAVLRYQLASAYQAVGRHDRAKEQLLATVKLDPLHASAHFKLAAYARQAGERDEARRRTEEFMRLRKLFGDETRTTDSLERCVYTDPEPPAASAARAARPGPVGVRFVDASDEFVPRDAASVKAACVLDVDKEGMPTLFVAGSERECGLLTGSAGERAMSMEDLGPILSSPIGAFSCRVGDFHDDVPDGVTFDADVHALADVFVLGADGVALLEQARSGGKRSFRDVTEAAGLKDVKARDAVWVDYEHDGDLDLLFATEAGARLWQNNGDGTFTDVTHPVGLTDEAAALAVAAADLDRNVAVDLLVTHGDRPTRVFENQRTGTFAPMSDPPGPWPPATRALVNDLTNNGFIDVVLLQPGEAVTILGREPHRPGIELSDFTPTAGVLLDYDNDGWLDVCLAGSGHNGPVRLWRNAADADGGLLWREVSGPSGLASLKPVEIRDMIAVDLDVDVDTDLLLVTKDGELRVLRNDGGNTNAQLKLHLTTVKTNPSGIGTRVEVHRGPTHISRTVTRLPIEIGVGPKEKLDAVQTVWTNGVIENQIDVEPVRVPLTIREKVVATGSCPFLYAWNGDGFRFVTDILGNAPLGLPIARDVMLPADVDEIVQVGTQRDFQPRDGVYTTQIGEEFCEVLYLDEARLIAVDHAPGVEVHSTDKVMPEPFPPSELWAVTAAWAPMRAVGDDGVDRTRAVAKLDDVYAPSGRPLPPPFRGSCYPLVLTLDFGPLDIDRPYVLALTGWLRYGQASTNIALSQNSARPVIPPKLEAETPDGWLPVDVVVGMPAGKTKTILADLAGKLPKGASRLRLTTTFEIAWDRIALVERTELPPASIHTLSPVSADLAWRGFSEIRVRVPSGPDTPAHDDVSDRPPWRMMMEGWCTRYGDVLELVNEVDDRVAIINAGDAVTLGFAADGLPPVPPGLVRTFFFYSLGIEKDCDHNVTDGATVAPLPLELPLEPPADGSGLWWLKYNTRFVPRDALEPAGR